MAFQKGLFQRPGSVPQLTSPREPLGLEWQWLEPLSLEQDVTHSIHSGLVNLHNSQETAIQKAAKEINGELAAPIAKDKGDIRSVPAQVDTKEMCFRRALGQTAH